MRLRQNKLVSFNEFLHEYTTADGSFLIGVTSLMRKHGLAPDYGGIPAAIMKQAAERGTAVHRLLEDYDNGKPVVDTEELAAYKTLNLEVHASEYLVSDNKTVATFIDKVFGDGSLADVKTTYTVHTKAVAWQLSISAYLFEMQNPSKKVPHLYCIHVRGSKAQLIEVKRISDERVKALITAEREGSIYMDIDDTPEVTEVLTESESVSLVASLNKAATLKELLAAEQAKINEVESKLLQYMEENNVDELKCDFGVYTRKPPYERTSIDSAKLKKSHPEIYNEYLKTTVVKGSLTFHEN